MTPAPGLRPDASGARFLRLRFLRSRFPSPRFLRRRSLKEWSLLVEAGALLFVARLGLRLLPVAHIVRWIRRPMHLSSHKSPSGQVEECRWAVTAFSKNAPVRLVCFPQALALHAMLRRRHIFSELLYGAARMEGGQLAAHAWLRQGGSVVIGGETAGSFSVLDTWSPRVNSQTPL